MAKLTVAQFVDLVKKSGLVDNERLNQALSGLDQTIKDSGVVASILTKAGLLTEWQSEKLLQGRHKGFYLGKYKLLNHIGTGGMGSVYLAEHLVMRHRVAIKLLPQSLASHPSYLERFHQEARASATLTHPNMVRAFDVDHEGVNHYLVMEYVDGQDLQAIVSRNGPLDYSMAADYTRQAAEGLEYAHRVGLIHRDIKPANLLVDKTGTVKILDMGLARFSDESQSSLTMAYDQKMIGTVDYLSPEQALDSHKVDTRVDIYSLGCTLYFMLIGDAPFPQGTIPQRLMQHQSAEPADIRATRPDCPEELIAICRKMMAKSADDRYQSAAEVSEALADFLGVNTSEEDSPRRQPPPQASGPSLNEDLDLAPLEDEPGTRTATRTPKQPTDASTVDSRSSSGSQTTGGSKVGASKSNIAASSSSVRNGESSSVISGAHSTVKVSKSGIKSAGASGVTKRQPTDLMDELLPQPKSPGIQAPPGMQPANSKQPEKFPMWLVVGVAVMLGFAVIATFVAWLKGGI